MATKLHSGRDPSRRSSPWKTTLLVLSLAVIAPWAAIATEPEAEELTEAPETLPEGDDPLRAETLVDAEVDPVEEIVVRADRVPQTVLQVPAAVSVVDQQAIQFARLSLIHI